ncbi:T9SS type A sorting domain-containing protein [Mariniphaga sp.]|uniref:T9SS type A sorting domain-containing protein n=1 Tax=Mariniphaga sp. TaxID=1954475 RepID=UPI003567913D
MHTVILFAFFFVASEAIGGDVLFNNRFHIRFMEMDRQQPVVTEIENIENFPADDVSLKLTIRNKLSLSVAYEWESSLGTIPANNSRLVEAPKPWVPQMTGTYQMSLQLNSSNDINPTNDTTSYDIEVMPPAYFKFNFNQLSFLNPFQQENSNTGRVDFTIPPNDTVQYVNFMFAVPNSSTPSQWLVQNLPLPAFPDTQEVSYWIDMEKLGIADGMEVPYLWYNYKYGTEPVLEPFESEFMYFSGVGKDTYNVGGDIGNEWEYKLGSYIPEIEWNSEWKVKTWNYRGCKVPNIDLDSSIYNPRDMADEVGDWNACGPASAVNSLQWLEDSIASIPNSGLSIREKLKLFNELSNRSDEDGLNTGGMIRGKLAYINSLKLPIHVKWQGVPYVDSIDSPNPKYGHKAESKNDSVGAHCTFDWIAAEMAKGEDVEIKFGWFDTLNVRHGGHWVVVSGVSDVTTARGLYVKDDEHQEKEGGMRQTFVNWVTDENGRPRLVGFKREDRLCWVESVLSESYDETVTFIPVSSAKIPLKNQLNLKVYQNPSPKGKPVNIHFDLQEPSEVQLLIYDLAGRMVYSRKTEYGHPGNKSTQWNSTGAESGTYIVKVISGRMESTEKVILQE